MENMDGIEAARRLRQKNRLCKIVFLTITEDYARMGYSLSASYYLLKPLSLHQADFEEAMELCQLKPPYEVMTLSVMADRQKLELPTEKILYIDYQNRMTRIHTAERVIPVSGGFQEVTAALQKDKRFLPCYRGVLINMDYISQVDSQTFLSLIHISEPTRRTPISYAVFCLKKKKRQPRLCQPDQDRLW